LGRPISFFSVVLWFGRFGKNRFSICLISRHNMVVMRYFASLFFLLTMVCLAGAEPPPRATYFCGLSDSAQGALDAAVRGDNKMSLMVGDGVFLLAGGDIKITGQVASTGTGDARVTDNAGPYFEGLEVHTFTGGNGEHAGRAAFSKDAKGAQVALVQLTDGQYYVGCFETSVASADFSAPDIKQQQTEAPQQPAQQAELPELTDEQKLEKAFATAPEQRGKERELLGTLALTKPDEGHYQCKRTAFFSDGDKRTNDQIDSDDDHTGFDLFADGSYRLKKTDGTFETDGAPWRHHPTAGTVLFADGTLEIYFKWPVHVRKKLSGTLPEVSLLYMTEYDSDEQIDEMTLCIFSGPTQSKSPNAEIAERSQKNLNPPPPGTPVKIAGLYYEQRWVPMMGFSNGTQPGMMYQQDYYYYRYLQANGYIWLGDPPNDGDFEKLDCSKPTVDEKGEPECTTYAIEDGLLSSPTIRIGHDAPVPFEESDGGIRIDATQYSFVKPSDDLKLDKFVRYFNYNGMSMREGNFTFKPDGTFESASASGISYTSEIPDVSRTTVTGYNPGDDLKGSYEIKGHTITLTNKNGGVSKMFFGHLSEGFFMIGGQPYFEPSD
jgi:hypothetical protein